MALDGIETVLPAQPEVLAGRRDSRADSGQQPSKATSRPETGSVPGRSSDTDSVKETTDAVRRFSRESDTRPSLRLSILFDKEAAVFVSRSVDARSGEVLNQFPPEVVVRRVAAVTELLRQDQKADVDIKA